MNYALKPPLLVAQVLPGLYCLLGVVALVWIVHPAALVALQNQVEHSNIWAAVYGVLAFVLACLTGFFLDAIRNGIIEDCIDRRCCLSDGEWWRVFVDGDKGKVKRLNAHYYSDYVLDMNIVIASAFLIVATIITTIVACFISTLAPQRCTLLLFALGFAVVGKVFSCDAKSLRKEIRSFAEEHLGIASAEKPPHHGVYTRIQPSEIHGVGVFAIRDIPKGTKIFYGDENEKMVQIDKAEAEREESVIRKLYEDFCVLKNGKYECPKNFNQMPISWHLNEPKEGDKPNVRCNEKYIFSALRDIKVGEELLTDYDTYSERPS